MEIRLERRGEDTDLAAVIDQAFASAEHSDGTEAQIVDRLRAAGALTLSLVAEDQGAIIGHVAFSPVTVDGKSAGWFGLGPVAVRPDRQRQGVGEALIGEGLAQLVATGAAGCVVLGEPSFYSRFGFVADPRLRYPGPPAEYFQTLAFGGVMPTGAVAYHPAFG
jgi:putative acetyltransferase